MGCQGKSDYFNFSISISNSLCLTSTSVLPHECQSCPARVLRPGTYIFEFEVDCRNNHEQDRNNIRRDMASHCRDVSTLHISLKQTYKFIQPEPILNSLGLPIQEIYRTADVCRVLNIKPDTFRARLYRNIYEDKYKKDNIGRIFTLEDIEELKR